MTPIQRHPNRRACPRLGLGVLLGIVVTGGWAPTAQTGTLYLWEDAQGVTHITDERPPDGVDYDTRDIATETGGSSGGPSEAVRRRRCRDFRGALTQLQKADDLPDNTAAWHAAKQRARRKIEQWCRSG